MLTSRPFPLSQDWSGIRLSTASKALTKVNVIVCETVATLGLMMPTTCTDKIIAVSFGISVVSSVCSKIVGSKSVHFFMVKVDGPVIVQEVVVMPLKLK